MHVALHGDIARGSLQAGPRVTVRTDRWELCNVYTTLKTYRTCTSGINENYVVIPRSGMKVSN